MKTPCYLFLAGALLSSCQLGTSTESTSSSGTFLGSSSSLILSSSLALSSSLSSITSSSCAGSSSSSVVGPANFILECPDTLVVADSVGKSTIHCMAVNLGDQNLNMIVYRHSLNLPTNWSSSFCFGPQCYANFTDSSSATNLPAHDSLLIPVYFNISSKGSGDLWIGLNQFGATSGAKEIHLEATY